MRSQNWNDEVAMRATLTARGGFDSPVSRPRLRGVHSLTVRYTAKGPLEFSADFRTLREWKLAIRNWRSCLGGNR